VLISVPNVSEGVREDVIEAVGAAFEPARLLRVHRDPDHGRSVFAVAAPQGELAGALVRGAQCAVRRIDLREHAGIHPHVGAIDVVPVVYLDDEQRGAACAEALTAGALIGDEVGLPVFLYGELATDPSRRERAALRRGGPDELRRRVEAGELEPDFGPPRLDPRSGAVLVAARPPLIAFNVDLATDDVGLARAIAADIREPGLPGVRALGLHLPARGRAQVSVNVHDHRAVPLAEVVARVRARAAIAECELVAPAPAAAFDGFPDDVPLRDFDPERDLLENALRSVAGDGTDETQAKA
jgi:glutamate formiminotransferase